jgi:ATP-dependent DNA helicase RecG
VGAYRARALKALGVETVEDLLHFFPRRYERPGQMTPLGNLRIGDHVTVLGTVASSSARTTRDQKRQVVTATVVDGHGGEVDLTFFCPRPHHAKSALARLSPGAQGLFTGIVSEYGGRLQLTHPATNMFLGMPGEIEQAKIDHDAPIPIYPASSKVPSWLIQAAIASVLPDFEGGMSDPLPQDIVILEGIPSLHQAMEWIHRPKTDDDWKRARYRFLFEEAFTAQVALARRRVETAAMRAKSRPLLPVDQAERSVLAAFDSRLEFDLTADQKLAGQVIAAHLSETSPMQRLLQGDVGSGKTVVALRAMLQVVDAGGQAALLAPTEVLAQQHFQTLCRILGPLRATPGEPAELLDLPPPASEAPAEEPSPPAVSPSEHPDDAAEPDGADAHHSARPDSADGHQGPAPVNIRLLTRSLGAAARRETLADLASGRAGIVIGTHALLSEPVDFADLGLVVIDEQHRFGVEQRDVLRTRGTRPPHVLVMTATPIPRSIAMTVFGELEQVTLHQMPGNRQPVATHVVHGSRPAWVERVWQRVAEEAEAGQGVFIVCPRIDANDDPPAGDDADSTAIDPDAGGPATGTAAGGRAGGAWKPHAAPGKTAAAARPLATVEEVAGWLRADERFARLRVETIHGRQPAEVKERTMQEFATGVIDLLVATTVIEVGVDIARATLMVVLDADRFGLAQLHQLRGRVGRGSEPGTCLLVSNAPPDSLAMRRLEAIARTADGFELAKLDLDLRHEGDILGAAQSGEGRTLRLLRVTRDEVLIGKARAMAWDLVAGDPRLLAHPILADYLARRLSAREDYLERT